MTTVIAGANLNYLRSVGEQEADIAYLKATADVQALVELTAASLQAVWTNAPHDLGRRSIRAAWHTFGEQIRRRRFVAVRINPDVKGLPPFWVVVVHMPPMRMRGPLYWAYARRLRKFLRSLHGEKVVFGDWNWLVKNDPARLRRTFGGRWYGVRIDGFWVSPGLRRHVADYVERHRRGRLDGHPFCYLTIGERP